MLFIAPSLLSGMGQVVKKYAELHGSSVIQINESVPSGQDVFLFALPIQQWIDRIDEIKKKSKSVICMTVCETETVHPAYGELFKKFKRIAVPSEFCQRVFSRQFPNTEFKLIRHWIPSAVRRNHIFNFSNGEPYIFYNIGNFLDHRKQCLKIIDAFQKLKLPNAVIIFKATCNQSVNIEIPNVFIVNDLLPDNIIQSMHTQCHCYVSFSNSEGVGMGAVEAALYDKPVIITEYGGAKEHVRTPYTIECDRKKVGVDDFLYTKDLEWGEPNFDQLMEFMKDAYEKDLKYMNHSYTKNLISSENVKNQFTTFHN
jgi:glycosyltransferase involved in cell wall biosynthesis